MSTRAAPRPRRKPKRRLPPEVLTNDEVLRLIDACSNTPTGLRNRALIAVLYRAGLRVSEALDLYPKDVDAAAGTIRVLHGKGDRSRVVGIDAGGFLTAQAIPEPGAFAALAGVAALGAGVLRRRRRAAV